LDLDVVPGLRPSPDRGVNIEPDFTWQGTTFSVPNSDIRARFVLPESTAGPVISAVVAGTPADKAGLRPGDVVAELNGQPVGGFRRFRRSIQSLAGTVRLTIEGQPRRELVIP
jgi:S1-C subfamily serine protease